MTDLPARLQSALADRYVIERVLGAGGMATVYLARDLKHDREVALKVLRPDLAAVLGTERFLQEIRITAQLDHPHILALIDSGQSEGFLWYVLPYIRGESLRVRLDRENQLSIESALGITSQIAGALEFAHRRGVIHRDLKPENILLFEGEAMLADFGIALAAKEAGGNRLTETGISLGTPQYMSPEQATGSKQLDGRTDIYSLGCVLYEMLAGDPPFTAATAQAIIARALVDPPPRLRTVRATVSSSMEQAVTKALAKVPADRFATAGEFMEALTSVSTEATGQLEKTRWFRRSALVALGVLVVGGGGVAVRRYLRQAGRAGSLTGHDLRLGPERVAVRYFEDLSEKQDLGYLADGLTEALIDTLKRAKMRSVVSKEGVDRYRDPEIPRDSIARALDVSTLIEGSVRRVGSQVRVVVWMFDATSGMESKRLSLESPPGEVLGLRTRLAGEVLDLLPQGLSDSTAAWILVQQGERARKDAEKATDPTAAIRALDRADVLLGRAESLDSNWVLPISLRGWIALSRARLARGLPEAVRWIEQGMEHATLALKLDPQHPRSLELRGTLRYALSRLDPTMDRQRRAALLRTASEDLDAAVRADQTLASAYATLSGIYFSSNDPSAALDRARQAYEADPFLSSSNLILSRLFWASYDTGRFSEAKKWCEEGRRRFPKKDEFTICRLFVFLTPEARPEIAESWQLAAGVEALADTNARRFQSRLARMLVGGVIGKAAKALPAGNQRATLADSARRVLVRARGDFGADPSQELKAYEAVMRVQMGDYDEAVDLLKQYMALNPHHSFRFGGVIHWWWRDLRNHPGFEALLRRRG